MFRANKHKLSWKLFSERKFVLVLLRRYISMSIGLRALSEKKREKNILFGVQLYGLFMEQLTD